MCSIEWVQPNSAASNKNMSWYLARNQQVASASPRGQESNPLKSSSLNSFPCLCLTVNFGGMRMLGSHHHPPTTKPPWVVQALGAPQLPWQSGFILEGLWVSCTVPYHHDFLFTSSPQLHVCVLYSEALWQRAILSPKGLNHDVNTFSSVGFPLFHQYHMGGEGLYGLYVLGEHYLVIAI